MAISSTTYSDDFGVTSRPASSRYLDRGLRLGKPTFASITRPSPYRPLDNGCADRILILGVAFLRNATTNKPGAINPNNFCLLGLFFLRNYYSGLFHHLYTGLSNGDHFKNGHVVVWSVSVHSSANTASGARTALQIQDLSHLHCVTLMPCIGIGFGARPHLFK